eukprot:CAMPEP_0184504652 /NCGR_PEP_ID=MMETSP0113_2-20130426/52578_1 /TAXON_ID=91329 /ORGANISM="Norrisiella sphaerica, Strain BC52" /LENGTH=393 /DNA_ID=CAMNT_0026894307 /DNA_START=174 /DNA_END=1353 /DNA_ORIENTATION=-
MTPVAAAVASLTPTFPSTPLAATPRFISLLPSLAAISRSSFESPHYEKNAGGIGGRKIRRTSQRRVLKALSSKRRWIWGRTGSDGVVEDGEGDLMDLIEDSTKGFDPEDEGFDPEDVMQGCALTEDGVPVISCAGAGIFIFWQLGALKYISTHFDLSSAYLHGGSAGAVLSTFIASGVDLNEAVRESYNIGMENDVWKRTSHFGLFGPLIREWLDRLLPPDAHQRCSGRVRILLTKVPSLKQKYVSHFESRKELISACMASIHVPLFLNYKPLKSFRGSYYLDGTLNDFLTRKNSPFLGCDGRAFVVDYYEDTGIQPKTLDFLRLKTHREVLYLVARGFRYARQLDMAGKLDNCLGAVRKITAGEPSKLQSHVVGGVPLTTASSSSSSSSSSS